MNKIIKTAFRIPFYLFIYYICNVCEVPTKMAREILI